MSAGLLRERFARPDGFTLVEVVVFIVIMGIAAVALFRSFASSMPRSPTPAELAQAAQLAQERMEVILGQRDRLGYTNASDLDPCNRGLVTPPLYCTTTYGFVVSSTGTGTAGWVAWGGNPTTNYKLVTVTVTLGGATRAQQNAVLSAYVP